MCVVDLPHPSISLSVVVPTRDTCALTCACLASLAASDAPADEVLLVDDGSRDGTVEAVAARFPDVRILRRESPGGFTAAVNQAWALAASDVVLLLNSDTEVAKDATARMTAAFASDPRLGIAGATLQYPGGRAQWSAGREPDALWLFALASGLGAAAGRLPGWRRVRPESQGAGNAGWVPATAMAVRRAVREAIGDFDPRFVLYAQDLDYCVRARARGWRVAQLRDVHVVHVRGASIDRAGQAASSGQDPSALLSDLARWVRKSQPRSRAGRLCAAMSAGNRLRVLTRTVSRPFVGRPRRAGWDRDTARYRAATQGLGSVPR
jgi:hypothetical protein